MKPFKWQYISVRDAAGGSAKSGMIIMGTLGTDSSTIQDLQQQPNNHTCTFLRSKVFPRVGILVLKRSMSRCSNFSGNSLLL